MNRERMKRADLFDQRTRRVEGDLMMKVFKVTFHMNNGEVLDFELKRPATYDVYKKIEEANHWFKLNNEIINLLNVNSIHVETE
ncbi:hypothetical protein M3573_03150 [Bacillus safensis]|nr:hypothetical protein [Bacillus safensis]MCM3137276.1 hypothetical protein [Bacillus safensis]